MSTENTAVVQSTLFGDSTGNQFRDLETIVGFPIKFHVKTSNPIPNITIMHSNVVDGITVTYYGPPHSHGGPGANGEVIVDHGTSPECKDPTLNITTVQLSGTENIIAITGVQGQTQNYGIRVTQITFIIFDSKNGKTRIAGPFGAGGGTPFRVTADANFIAFDGFAVDTDESVAQATQAGHSGGLYGLVFAQIASVSA